MHAQTHIMAGWCIASLFDLSPRQRLFCMLAAALADIDGLGFILGERFFADYHHVLAHNVFFGLLLSATLAILSPRSIILFPLYLALFHLHLAMDYAGSGPAWRIHYLWPLMEKGWRWAYAWRFYSWQNITAAFALLAWTILIALRQGRTPLELLMPSLDRQLVAMLQRKVRPEVKT